VILPFIRYSPYSRIDTIDTPAGMTCNSSKSLRRCTLKRSAHQRRLSVLKSDV